MSTTAPPLPSLLESLEEEEGEEEDDDAEEEKEIGR
jgi:hypothetical protein